MDSACGVRRKPCVYVDATFTVPAAPQRQPSEPTCAKPSQTKPGTSSSTAPQQVQQQGKGLRMPRGQLVFDSDFEGGNLLSATVSPDDSAEWELKLRGDSCNSKYRLWFHFRVSNALPGQQVVLSVVNFSKTRSLYRHGMSPVVRSALHPAWQRVPARSTFYYKSAKHGGRYVLSFVFVFDEDDTYEFAYSFPFTYTTLQYELGYLEFLGKPFLRRQLLTRTPQQRRVDALVVSQPLLPCPSEGLGVYHVAATRGGIGEAALRRRPVVFISSRVHPGETPASFVTQGLLAFLLGHDPRAVALRSAITFVIIPMLNPDGAFLGNYRTDAGGVDLNRVWQAANAPALPALHHALGLLQAYSRHPAFQVDLFVDVHAHSTSQRSFTFGNQPTAACVSDGSGGGGSSSGGGVSGGAAAAAPGPPMDPVERAARFPRLLERHLPGFSLPACSYEDSAAKAGCARRAVGALVPEAQCYTLEVSFFHTTDTVVVQTGEPTGTDFSNTIEGYMEMGRGLGLAILDWYGLSVSTPTPTSLAAEASSALSTGAASRPGSTRAGSASRAAGAAAALPSGPSPSGAASEGARGSDARGAAGTAAVAAAAARRAGSASTGLGAAASGSGRASVLQQPVAGGGGTRAAARSGSGIAQRSAPAQVSSGRHVASARAKELGVPQQLDSLMSVGRVPGLPGTSTAETPGGARDRRT